MTVHVTWMISPSATVTGAGRTYSAATKTLTVCTNDTVHFVWSARLRHNLIRVSAAQYGACDTHGKVLAGGSGVRSGAFAVPAGSTPSISYFLDGVASHCHSGQKLTLVVKKC